MQPINKLLKELKYYKENWIFFRDICDVKNAVIDYMNETQDFSLDELLYEIVDYDQVMECIEYKAKSLDFRGIKDLMDGLERDDRYRDNGDYFENIDREDLEDRLDEIIEEVKQIKKKKK